LGEPLIFFFNNFTAQQKEDSFTAHKKKTGDEETQLFILDDRIAGPLAEKSFFFSCKTRETLNFLRKHSLTVTSASCQAFGRTSYHGRFALREE
jgi:hypothetical protein